MVAAHGDPADSTATAASGVLVSLASRPLRRSLTPLEWVVLEDVSLDAVEDGNGLLVAATSARQVAEHLGVSPGSAAKALGRLRSLGLVTHDRQPGPAGRFGLSLYRLVPPPGVEVVGRSGSALPRTGSPRMESPVTATPRAADRHMVAGARAATKAEAATGPTQSVRRPAPVRDHHQLDLLAPAAPAPNATPPPTPTTTNHTHNQSPNQPNQSPNQPNQPSTNPPSTTPPSNNPTPTRTDTCQLFEQATGRRRAERC